MIKNILLVTILLIPVSSFAQGQERPRVVNDPPVGVTVEAPALTDVEKAKLETASVLATVNELVQELAQTRQMLAQFMVRLNQYEPQAQKDIGSKYLTDLIKQIEDARPGFKFDPSTGKFSPIK